MSKTDDTAVFVLISVLVIAFVAVSFWFTWQQIEIGARIQQLNICAAMEHPEQNPRCP